MLWVADTAASVKTVGDMGALIATRFPALDLAGLQNFKLPRDLVCHLSFTFTNVKAIGQITLARQPTSEKIFINQYIEKSWSVAAVERNRAQPPSPSRVHVKRTPRRNRAQARVGQESVVA
jgi:hypothetical protein